MDVRDATRRTRSRQNVLPVDIPVRPVNVPAESWVPEELAGPVRVEVRVEENVFDSLTKEDFEATVDLEGLTVGEYELPVEVRAADRPRQPAYRGGASGDRFRCTLQQLAEQDSARGG